MATCRTSSPLKLVLLFFLTSDFLCDFQILADNSKKLSLQLNRQSQGSDVEAGNLAITHVPRSVSFRATAGSIQLQDISQVISLALGFSSLQDVQWKGLLAGKIFDHPKANILFIIEGFGKGVALPFFSKTLSYPIVKKQAELNLDIVRISPSENFVSHINNILEKKPLVISFSVANKLARGSSAIGPNAHTITWDAEKQLFLDNNANGLTMSKKELLKGFESVDFGEGVKYQKEKNKIAVSVPGMEDIFFDMNDADDFLFFAELEMIINLYNKVKGFTHLVHDDYPDFYTFGISSLKELSLHHGNNSNQVLAALHVLNNFVPQMSSLFNQLYGEQALTEVVNLEINEIDRYQKKSSEINDLYQHVQDQLQSPSLENFQENLPEIKLRDNLEDHVTTQICESIQSKLLAMHSNLKVNCDSPNNDIHIRSKREVAADKDCSNHNLASINDKYDSDFPVTFNIILWLMITIGLALYVICLVLWYMDPGRDSIIYRVTSQHIKSE